MVDMKIMARAMQVRALFLDVDGTLTDGRLYLFPSGMARAFCALDGYGLRMLIQQGILVAIITAAASNGVEERARQLGITEVHAAVENKLTVMQNILTKNGISAAEAAFMGDDLPDLAAMQHAGFAIAPQTAVTAVLEAAHYVPALPAGGGAVRELCDLIIAAQEVV